MNEGELRRQATAAGVFLDIGGSMTGVVLNGDRVAAWTDQSGNRHEQPLASRQPLYRPSSPPPLTPDEVAELMVWLDRWTSSDQPRERHELAWVCSACGHHFPVTPGEEHEPMWEDCANADCSGRIGSIDWKTEYYGECVIHDPSAPGGPSYVLPIVRPLLDPPAGFELARKSWCPRCDRAASRSACGACDPLGRPVERRRCEVVPPAPLVEIGTVCPRSVRLGFPRSSLIDGAPYCGTRRLYRWGLRRQQKPALMWPQELFRD